MASGPCEPHLKAEHMAAPTNAANVKKALANSEPSTHGTSRHFAAAQQFGRIWSEADINHRAGFMSTRPSRLLKMQLKWALASGWRCLRV
jgi:hypothetical protein